MKLFVQLILLGLKKTWSSRTGVSTIVFLELAISSKYLSTGRREHEEVLE